MAESQGNPPPNGGPGTDTPQGSDAQPNYVTQDQIEVIVKNSMNAAITSRISDFEKRLNKSLGDRDTKLAGSLTEALSERFGAALDEKLAALKPKEEDQQKGKTQEPPPPPKWEESPAYKALQKQLADLKKANDDAEARRLQAEQQRRSVELRSTLTSELAKHGITGERAEFALGHLVDSRKLVYHRPESDELVFKSGDDELPLTDGLKSWVGTDQGKFFLPPKGTQGSGDKPGGGSNGGSGGGADPNNPLAQLGNTLIAHLRRGG